MGGRIVCADGWARDGGKSNVVVIRRVGKVLGQHGVVRVHAWSSILGAV